jgi:hypothetical protein
MDMYLTALAWQRQGVATIPTLEKRAVVSWKRYQPDGGSLPPSDILYTWFGNPRLARPGRGLAVVCGWRGLTVLDFDTLDGWAAWRSWAQAQGGIAGAVAEQGYAVMTPRPGVHVYVSCAEAVQSQAIVIAGVKVGDVKGRGGYVLAPPTVRTGGAYMSLWAAGQLYTVDRLTDVLPSTWLVTPEPTARVITFNPILGGRASTGIAPAVPDLAAAAQYIKKNLPAWVVVGVQPEPSGNGKGLAVCPLHDDHRPSLSCDLVTGRVHCFAGCTGRHGWDAIDAARWLHGLTYPQAVRYLTAQLERGG